VEGGYFLLANVRATGRTAWEFCQWLAAEKKVCWSPAEAGSSMHSYLGP